MFTDWPDSLHTFRSVCVRRCTNKGYHGARFLQSLCIQAGGAVPVGVESSPAHMREPGKVVFRKQDTASWPLKSPHTLRLNAECDTYMHPSSTPTCTPSWILSCCSSVLTQQRTDIQIYVWNFGHDFQMNNSGLIFRGWHELNIQHSVPTISV